MNRKGFTLVGAVLMGLLIAVMTVAGMDFYGALRQQRIYITDRFTAINLATAQLEDLMGLISYTDPLLNPIADPPHPTTFDAATVPAGFTVTYTVSADQAFNFVSTTGVGFSINRKLLTVTARDPRGNTVTVQGFKTP